MSSSAQGTAEWRAARCGRLTASRVADVIAKTKTGWSASRGTYMGQLLGERLTGAPAEQHVTPAMRWGSACEDHARAAYVFYTDREVTTVGFVDHPHIAMSGASPDGLVGEDGLLEIKCPTTASHLDTLVGAETPSKHLPQIQWQLACTGRSWCDFISFDPRLPECLRFFVHRVHRDSAAIAELELRAEAFLAELDAQARWVFACRLQLGVAA